MSPLRLRASAAFASALLACLAPLGAQEGVPAPPGLVPEQMWPAPTAADWQKPVLIQWQRTWDDAVRLSQATKKPILVCVNMDGEIASEHYAGIRYRDPEVAKLFEPYVCVIASVYRHNPRDYDEQGRRIPCPRLGCVTCGEHIAMEPLVYARFLDGKRISPRHIMVELDGSETYDVFYTWDVKSVLTTLQDGIAKRAIQAPPVVKGDKSLLERLQSPDSADREAVEQAFAKADAAQKQALLEAALQQGEQAPIEILRQAAYGLDPDLAKRARQGLLQAKDPGAVELIADTLRAPLDAAERQQLVEALARFGEQNSKARTLATAHRGLAATQAAIDSSRWAQVMQGQSYAAAASGPADAAGDAGARDRALQQQPASAEARLGVAEANLLQALDGLGGPARLQQRFRTMLLQDAERQAAAAAAAGAAGWRPAAVRAVALAQLGRSDEAYRLAIDAAPQLPPDAPGPLAVELLALFAEARQEAIQAAVRQKRDFDPQWTNDVHAAYAVLGKHPLGRDVHVAHHYDFLHFFGTPEADAALDRGLVRFPASPLLHERLRQRILQQQEPAALEAEYARRLAAPAADPSLPWFAGYAGLVVAEAHRRKNDPAAALGAYARALGHFDRYQQATGQTDASHYAAIAHAGIARVQLEQGELDAAFAALRAAFAANGAAAAALDGLSLSGMMTADMLKGLARQQGRQDLLEQLDEELRKLPPEAFELPFYEQGTGRRPRRPPQRR